MPLTLLWTCFAVVVLLSMALAIQTWRFLGRGSFIGRYLALWFATAFCAALALMLRPGQEVPPWLLPVAIAALTLQFTLVLSRRSDLQPHVRGATLGDLYGQQTLRAAFGLVILVAGGLGLVPQPFAWAAGLGDVAVGVAALLLRKCRVSGKPGKILAWAFTLIGVVDLLNAGRMGATLVVPWLAERQWPGVLPMLPFFGVPIFLAHHIQTARQLLRRPT